MARTPLLGRTHHRSSSLNAAAWISATPGACPCTQSFPRYHFFSLKRPRKEVSNEKSIYFNRVTSSYNRQGERSARFKGRVTSATVAQRGRILFKEEPAIKNSLGKVLPTRPSALFGAQKPSWCFQDDARLPVPLLGAINMSWFFLGGGAALLRADRRQANRGGGARPNVLGSQEINHEGSKMNRLNGIFFNSLS